MARWRGNCHSPSTLAEFVNLSEILLLVNFLKFNILLAEQDAPSSVSHCVKFEYWPCVSKPDLYPLTIPSRNPELAYTRHGT